MARVETRRRLAGRAWSATAGSRIGRLLAVCAVALTTANCANAPRQMAGGSSSDIDPKYGVRASKRLYNEGDAIPKGGGRRYAGKPYVVAGRTYVPREDARGYVREGLASWYGSAFHGRLTANGEVFDRHSIAAAHPTLPLPSYARVTNLDSGRSMVVRVNDRGPYHENRVMDVSEEAARALDFHRNGTARVRVEYVGKASIAGSDDRKLLATLRTDGRPASIGRSPVMLADLGADAAEPATERLARPLRQPLAFKPAEDEALAQHRPLPTVVASRPSLPVPSAIQPTGERKIVLASVSSPARGGRRETAAAQGPPLSLAPPPLHIAGALRPERDASTMQRPRATASMAKDMPKESKLAMAKLAAAAAPKPVGSKATPISGAKPAPRRQMAGID